MNRSLRHIFFRRLNLLAVVSAAVFGLLLVHAERVILLNDLQNKGESIARILTAVTLDAVMVHDYATVERYASDVISDHDIVSLVVKRADGEVLAAYSKKTEADHFFTISHPVMIGNEVLGEVHLDFSTERVRYISRNLLLATVAAVTIFHLLGVFISRSALKSAVIMPLDKLNLAIHTLRQGDLDQHIDIREPVEFADLGGAFNEMAVTIRETFDGLRQQQELVQFEQAKLAAIVGSMADGMFVTDNYGVIIAFNQSAEAISGFSEAEALGEKCTELYRTSLCEDACALNHAGETIRNKETTMLTKEGRLINVAVSSAMLFDTEGEVVGGVQTFRDITAEKKQHEIYCHTEKLAAIGQLAAGVAHEINTPLGNIMGYARYIKPDAPFGEIERKMAVIVEQARKCSDIVQGLLHFARSSGAEPENFDLNALISQSLIMVRYQAEGQRTALHFQGTEQLMGFADAHKIEQVIFNLLHNALQALEQKGNIWVDSGRAGKNIYFSVRDDGPGINEAIMHLIFDPFFTTKPVGQGTGLGLSICAGIVAEAHGSIDVEPVAEGGIRFTVLLPSSADVQEKIS